MLTVSSSCLTFCSTLNFLESTLLEHNHRDLVLIIIENLVAIWALTWNIKMLWMLLTVFEQFCMYPVQTHTCFFFFFKEMSVRIRLDFFNHSLLLSHFCFDNLLSSVFLLTYRSTASSAHLQGLFSMLHNHVLYLNLIVSILSFYRYKLFPLHQNCRTAESIRVCNKEYFWWLLIKEDEGLYQPVDVVQTHILVKVMP